MGQYFSKKEDGGYSCEYCPFESENKGEMLKHHTEGSDNECPERFGKNLTEEFEDYYSEIKIRIDQKLQDIFNVENDPTLSQILQHSVKGGKRFRPTLTVLVSDSLGGSRSKALTHAACIELFHNATLAHDDILDNDKTRRGNASLFSFIQDASNGLPTPPGTPDELQPRRIATLAGDGILARALLQVGNKPEVVRASSEALYSILKGALNEAKNLNKIVSREGLDGYIEVARMKTGSLFGLATRVGSMTSPEGRRFEDKAHEYGMNLGVAYQIADDLAEEEVPEGLDPDRLSEIGTKTINECKQIVGTFPENEYTDMLEVVPDYMIKTMLEQEGKDPSEFFNVE